MSIPSPPGTQGLTQFLSQCHAPTYRAAGQPRTRPCGPAKRRRQQRRVWRRPPCRLAQLPARSPPSRGSPGPLPARPVPDDPRAGPPLPATPERVAGGDRAHSQEGGVPFGDPGNERVARVSIPSSSRSQGHTGSSRPRTLPRGRLVSRVKERSAQRSGHSSTTGPVAAGRHHPLPSSQELRGRSAGRGVSGPRSEHPTATEGRTPGCGAAGTSAVRPRRRTAAGRTNGAPKRACARTMP